MGVVFFLIVSGRVKIHGVGDLRMKNDKDGAPVAAGKRHLKLFPIEKGLFETDLLWMIKHEDNFPVLILYHEVLEVVPGSFMLKGAKTQERLVHVVRIHHTDLRDFFTVHDRAHM